MDPTRQIIGIDHGNANIKTAHCVFPADLLSSKVNLGHEGTLKYGFTYHNLSDHCSAPKTDKIGDDKYYILTLFGIAKELEKRGVSGTEFTISLGIGLPPGTMNESSVLDFKNYFFMDHIFDFKYDRHPYHITFDEIKVFPQGFSAIFAEKDRYNFYEKQNVVIIDVGGGTTEILVLSNGRPDVKLVTSLPKGTITFAAEIQRRVMSNYRLKISERTIKEAMDYDPDILLIPEAISTIRSCYTEFAKELLEQVKMISPEDLSFTDIFLTGGGAGYFTRFFERLKHDQKIRSLYIQDNICANAIGYELLMR